MTSDAFLDALREDPSDDVTRLVYSDWLEDRGDSARAEFIRLGVRLDAIDADDPERAALHERYEELRTTNHADWLGEIPASLEDVALRGGLVTRLVFRSDAPASDMLPLLARHPVSEISICGERSVRDLAKAPWLGSIRALTMRQGLRKRQVQVLDRLLDSPHLMGLRELTLIGDTVDNYLARVIALSIPLRQLHSLRLERTLLDDVGVRRLIEPGTLPDLEHWHVECPQATSRSLRDLFAPSRLERWRSLHWPVVRLLDHADFDGLGECRGVRQLHIASVFGLPAPGRMQEWLSAMPVLTELHLAGPVGIDHAYMLAGWPGLAWLKRLALQTRYSNASAEIDLVRNTLRSSIHFDRATKLEITS